MKTNHEESSSFFRHKKNICMCLQLRDRVHVVSPAQSGRGAGVDVKIEDGEEE